MLEYRNVYKAFDRPVLAGASLLVRRGERVAVVGSSGTGKSVLLKMAIGLIDPDEGDVLLDGESVVHADRHALERLRRKVGYVFQGAALFDSLSVHENVAQGFDPDTVSAMTSAEVHRRVERALERVNLDPEAVSDKLPSELSGGMRKRVGLARAIVREPSILLYDEPVTGLDPVNAAAVSLLIAKTAEGVTSLLVTHDVPGALEICDQIALLHDGRMVFVGTPAEFMAATDPLVSAFAHRDIARRKALELSATI